MKTSLTRYLAPAVLLGAALLPLTAQAQRPFFGHGPEQSALYWSGDVDETAIIYVHGDQTHDRNVRGKGVDNENANFDGRLPHRPMFVSLLNWDGRGEVRVVQQPSPDNDFTAGVRVHDPQPGQGHYHFTLVWHPIPGGYGY